MNKKHFTLFTTTHTVIAFAVVALLAAFGNYSLRASVLHALLIYNIYSVLYITLRLSKSYFGILSRWVFSVLSSFIMLLYVTNLISNHFWHSNVSAEFIRKYSLALPMLLAEVKGATFGIVFLILIVVGFNYWLYKTLMKTDSSSKSATTFKDAWLPLLISIMVGVTFSISFERTNPGIWEGEPLTSLLISTGFSDYDSIKSLQEINISPAEHVVTTADSKPNIIFMHLDAVRADHTSVYGYTRNTTPNLSRLIGESGVKIENAFSICSESICGMMSALAAHRVWKNKKMDLIHENLKRSGYTNHLIGTGDFGWEGIDRYLGVASDSFIRADMDDDYNIHDDHIILDGLKALPNYDGNPNFIFLRYMSSHPVGLHFARFKKFSPHEKSILSMLRPSLQNEITLNAYDNGLVQVDHFVNEAVKALTAKGYLQKYIIVIYGDHGEALGEHGYYGHYTGLYQEEIGVPIIILSDQDLSEINTRYATLNDIYPTVLDLASLPSQTGLDGMSLVGEKEQKRFSFHESRTGIYAIIHHDGQRIFKYIWDNKNENGLLFDLELDELEKHNLIIQYPLVSEDYKNRLFEYFGL